jgi:hypothetical protein
LSAAKQPDIITIIIRSLHQCNLRPNETSITAILKHYTATDDPDSFVHFVQRMRGKHSGLALAHPDTRITDVSNGRLIPHEDDPTKIIQLPYPTPKVFAALIAGVTKFGGFDTALGVCKNMGEEGWGVCMSGLDPLLQDCADRKDWESGLSVWEQVQQLEAKSRRMSSNRERGAERIPLQVYAAMLRLCLGSGELERYEDVWQQATKIHRHRAWELAKRVKAQMGVFDKPTPDELESGEVVDDALQATAIPESQVGAALDGDGAARLYSANGVLHESRAHQRTSTHREPLRYSEYSELNTFPDGQPSESLPASNER